ncbi:MAG: hypothetical protein HN952_06200 [Candidatus Cloacimonetes bacterium]|nr:hypothetical protein [Candidatus Cloacimonadota bacterium]
MSKQMKLQVTSDTKNAEAGMKRVDGSIKNTVKSLALATAGLIAMKKGFDFMKGSIDLAMKQEQTFRSLQSAVELTGKSWGGAKSELDVLFASLQKTTKYGDTDSAQVLQQLTTLSGDYEQSVKALPVTLDMASSGLFDMSSASRYVGMALSGNVEMLGRFIPELKSTVSPQLKLMSATEKTAFALDVLKKKFGGLAEKELETTNAKIIQMKNYWGDLQEAIGDEFLLTISKTTDGVVPLIDEWTVALKLHQTELDLTSDAYINLGSKARNEIVKQRQELIKTAILLEEQPNEWQIAWRSFRNSVVWIYEFEEKWFGIYGVVSSITKELFNMANVLFSINVGGSVIDEDKIKVLNEEYAKLNRELGLVGRFADGLEDKFNIPSIAEQIEGLLNLGEATSGILLPDVTDEIETPDDDTQARFSKSLGKDIESSKMALESWRVYQLTEEEKELDALRLQFEKKTILNEEYQARKTEIEKEASERRKQITAMELSTKLNAIGSLVGAMATLNKSSKGSAKVTKRLMQAEAIISTYAAANKALAAGVPPWNYIQAGIVTMKGLANVQQIEAQKFAQGGDFIVPQGYPNDSYPIMVESGERVQITPTNQVSNLDAEILSALNQIISKPIANTVVFDDIEMSRYVERGGIRRSTI